MEKPGKSRVKLPGMGAIEVVEKAAEEVPGVGATVLGKDAIEVLGVGVIELAGKATIEVLGVGDIVLGKAAVELVAGTIEDLKWPERPP